MCGAEGQEGPVSWKDQTGSVLGTAGMCQKGPAGFLLLSTATGCQGRGAEPSGPPPGLSAPLFPSGQVQLWPLCSAPGQKGLERGWTGLSSILRGPEELEAPSLLLMPLLPSLLSCPGCPGAPWLSPSPSCLGRAPKLRQCPWGVGRVCSGCWGQSQGFGDRGAAGFYQMDTKARAQGSPGGGGC